MQASRTVRRARFAPAVDDLFGPHGCAAKRGNMCANVKIVVETRRLSMVKLAPADGNGHAIVAGKCAVLGADHAQHPGARTLGHTEIVGVVTMPAASVWS